MDATTKSKEILFLPIAINLEKNDSMQVESNQEWMFVTATSRNWKSELVTFNIEIGTVVL